MWCCYECDDDDDDISNTGSVCTLCHHSISESYVSV